ncbi:four-carbon acid sugar kinase family protein [Salmonella enterica]|nr:four-carbon acid sugar kinase family protein [Salmonella enterica]
MLKIGVIADDFTGATDIASFLVENGMPTVQINDVPTGTQPEGCDAVVISLKTRSCPAQEAIKQSLAALIWLKKQGCQQVYFKYCSTFDSTAEGNIGPVTDALMVALDTLFTVISPALPVNGRTVYQGYLFVMNHLLAESGMRHHPINPMTDSYLPRLMEAQAQGRCGVSQARSAGYPLSGRAVVLSGSCSQMTNQQVAFYRQHAPTRDVDVARCLSSETREAYAEALAQWVLSQDSELAPMISATASTQALAAIQQQYGATEASHAVEALFSLLAARLAEGGITRFIVAGGETSGVVTQSLGITGFHIGPCISPGVPWVNALHAPVSLALKSGNFGDESFFIRAQREFQV